MGLAELGGRFYVADAKANIIRSGPTHSPALDQAIPVAAPTSLSADRATGRLWVISKGTRLVALDQRGKVVADVAPVADAAALAARRPARRRLTGDGQGPHLRRPRPQALVPQGTLGTGDGPFGPYQPDRFLFQRPASGSEPGCEVTLALGPDGALAVTDANRLLVFDRHGKSLWTTFGLSGDACVLSFADRGRLFTTDGRKSVRLMERSGTWSPYAFWDVPQGTFFGAFADGGKTFGVFVIATVHEQHGPLLVVRYEGHASRPVLLLAQDPKTGQHLARTDTNHDGRLDQHDTGTAIAPPAGAANPPPARSRRPPGSTAPSSRAATWSRSTSSTRPGA